MGVKCEASALGSQEGNGIGFQLGRGLPRTLHFHWPRGLGEDKIGQYAIPSPLPMPLHLGHQRLFGQLP